MSNPQTNKRIRVLTRAGGFLLLAALPVLLGAGDDGRTTFDARRKQIEGMNVNERAQLERRYKMFVNLPESKRETYRQLRRQIEEDSELGGRLEDVMHRYHDWLKTLSPWQRDEIINESNLKARIDLIRNFKQHRGRELQMLPPGSLGTGSGFNRLANSGPSLSPRDLAAVVRVLERQVRIPPDRRKQFESLEPRKRHLSVLIASIRQSRDWQRSGRVRWPGEQLLTEMIAAISDSGMREQLNAIERPDQRRTILSTMIVKAFFAEWHQELEKRMPNEEEVGKFFVALDRRQQDEIMSLPLNEQKRRLTWMYLSQHGDQVFNELNELRRTLQRVFPRGGNRQPFRNGIGRPPKFDRSKPPQKPRRNP